MKHLIVVSFALGLFTSAWAQAPAEPQTPAPAAAEQPVKRQAKPSPKTRKTVRKPRKAAAKPAKAAKSAPAPKPEPMKQAQPEQPKAPQGR